MSAQLSEAIVNLDDLPTAPPKLLKGMKPVPAKQRSQPVPKMKPVRSSEIAEAVIRRKPLITRNDMAAAIEPYAKYLAEDMRSIPEPEPEGEPNQQFYYSWKSLGIINIARKSNEISLEHERVLLKAEGQESGHFVHFEKHSSLRYSP